MVILISGITSGFGRAMAQRLSADGHKVYGTYRKASDPIEGVTYIKCEVSSDSEVEATVAQVVNAEGKIDAFINNAGTGIGGPLEFCSLEDAKRQMDVNFLGMVRFLHFVVPIMRKQGFGKILCLSSIGGLMGLPYQGLYSASKYAIEGYCEALRLELSKSGVSVTVVEPGDFSTGFTAQRKSSTGPEVHEAYPGYARSLQSIEHDETSGLKPEYLAGKISKIIAAKQPPYNIIIATPMQKMSVWLKTILPRRTFAKILSIYYKL